MTDEIEALREEAAEWHRQAIYHNRKHGEVLEQLRQAEADRNAWTLTAAHNYRKQKKQTFVAAQVAKPLKWTWLEEQEAFCCTNPLDRSEYRVFKTDDEGTMWTAAHISELDAANGGTYTNLGTNYESPEDAQSAVQDFWRCRVKDCLEYAFFFQIGPEYYLDEA